MSSCHCASFESGPSLLLLTKTATLRFTKPLKLVYFTAKRGSPLQKFIHNEESRNSRTKFPWESTQVSTVQSLIIKLQ